VLPRSTLGQWRFEWHDSKYCSTALTAGRACHLALSRSLHKGKMKHQKVKKTDMMMIPAVAPTNDNDENTMHKSSGREVREGEKKKKNKRILQGFTWRGADTCLFSVLIQFRALFFLSLLPPPSPVVREAYLFGSPSLEGGSERPVLWLSPSRLSYTLLQNLRQAPSCQFHLLFPILFIPTHSDCI